MADKKEITVRRWKKSDLDAIITCQRRAYSDLPKRDLYDRRNLELQLQAFPEGQYVAVCNKQIVGYATSLIVELQDDGHHYKYDEITGHSTFSTHDPSGDTLYGADIAVDPDYRGMGISSKLYKRRKRLLNRFNLRRMIAYGRLPQFGEVAGQYTAEEYVELVKKGERYDSALTAHLKAGYEIKSVLLDFFHDKSSLHYSTYLEMVNPQYDRVKRRVAASPIRRTNRKMRVCTAQFETKQIKDWQEFENTCRFFGLTANNYHCHFLVFPEYFTSSLTSLLDVNATPLETVNKLADMKDRVLELIVEIAKKEQIYIVAGTTPERRGEKIYNVSHIVTPTGGVFSQDKIHITPSERTLWGISPGESLKVFETPFGRIAIQICYDIEFPETSRLLALAGVEVIFVPFNTDEQRSFHRVQFTARSRAVENYIYVVTSGLVGNLYTVGHSSINYGQSAVYTPSDIAFPERAIAGIADPNVETVITAELDFETLALQRQIGTVRPFFDRRNDMYELIAKVPLEIVRV